MVVKITRSFIAPVRGIGKPDYTRELAKGTIIPGYRLEYGEELLWLCYIFVEVPGPSIITRLPLPIGATVRAIDPFTGADHIDFPSGWDFILKELWISFNQDILIQLFQGGTFNDICCRCYYNTGMPPINVFEVSWARSLIEDISVASTLVMDITNMGGAQAVGKAWLLGMMKLGAYEWL